MTSTVEEMASEENNDLPEIYVDESILNPIVLDCLTEESNNSLIYDKVYEINGTTFREDVWKDSDTLSLFEIQTTDTGNGEMEVTIHEAADIYLPVSIQETPYGLIINSNMLLTVGQWNTIVEHDETHKCIVCDTNIGGTIEHIDSDVHLRNLEKYQPLKKFDLSITRLIDGVYHCGVCNECFDEKEENQHFDSKNHEDKMLFATNRASDVLYDFDLHDEYRNSDQGNADNGNKNIDCYHFNRNRILSLSDTSGFDSAEGFYDYDYDDNVPFASDNDNESNDNECSSNDNEYNVTENNEYNEPNYISYASIAKKVAATPDYLYVTILDKKMKMKFDHWHMINTVKSNQLYCMVCKKYYQITLKAQHCAEKAHLDRLKRYKFVEDYKNYFIRKIDFKYYHCGICNNIQLADEIKQHIQAKHKKKAIPALLTEVVRSPKRNKNNDNSAKNTKTGNDKTVTLPLFKEPQNNRNTDKTSQVKDTNINNVNQTVINTRNDNNENLAISITSTNNENVINAKNENNVNATKVTNNDNECEINNDTPSLYNDIVLNQNGFRIRVSFMSYNFVSKRQNDYYCHVCNVTACDTKMTCHIKEQEHINMLKKLQFQEKYGIHLIRMIAFQDHCAICNVVFNMEQTKAHILDPNHIQMLSKALATNNYQIHPYDTMNQPRNDSNQRAMHQPPICMNQPPTAMNQPPMAMNQPPMAMNQPPMAMNQPPMPMNQPPIFPQITGMHQLPMHPPIMGMNQPPILPPTLGMQRWPAPQPTIGIHASQSVMDLNQCAINQLQIYTNQLKTNMNQQENNLPKLDMNQPATNRPLETIQHTFNRNQRTTSMPNLDINQSKIEINQDKIHINQDRIDVNQDKIHINQEKIDVNQDKNQQNTIESKIDTSQPKKEMIQRATNQSKMEDNSKIESIQDMFDLNESLDDVDDDFEYFNDKFVYLKFKNTFIQVTFASYNSLIKIGDGTAYCFVCSLRVHGSMKNHVESKNHAKCMDECKFVSKYERHLLRQMFLNYHCSLCNIIFTRKDINKHITWPLHAQDNKTDKKARRKDIKSGGKLLNVNFQNEAIYLNEKEPEIKVLVKIEIRANGQNEEILQKKNKIIIFDGKVLRISWDAYHGFVKIRSGHRCVLCQRDVRSYEWGSHVAGAYHKRLLDAFETAHLPHLIRKINETMLNCVICNVEVPNKEYVLADHISAKKHKKYYDAILLDSSTVDSYADCNEDVLNLYSS